MAPYFGYLASLALIIALLVNNDLKFRWFNAAGSTFFIVYAIIIHAFPVLLTNSILLCINIVYLVRVYRKKEIFDLLEFKGEEKLVSKFLAFYQKDIEAYFPGFKAEEMKDNLNFVIIRNLVIANIFSASLSPEGDATVLINYTVEKYRDYKTGRFIFEKERDNLIAKGVRKIIYKKVYKKQHERFLKIMGFVNVPDEGASAFIRTL
jgi:Bacterial inner membrane protein